MSSTREQILELALRRFNENGLHAVAVRDLAQELELSPGNVTYYFPKKEDIVRELAARLSARNDETYGQVADPKGFDDFFRAVSLGLENLYDFRFLNISFVQVLTEYPSVAESYGAVESRRRSGLLATLRALQCRGLLRSEVRAEELERTGHILSMLVRFSIPDQTVRKSWNQDRPIPHYLSLMAQALVGIASDAGKTQLAPYFVEQAAPPCSGKREPTRSATPRKKAQPKQR